MTRIIKAEEQAMQSRPPYYSFRTLRVLGMTRINKMMEMEME
jgi:hypothetical protein